MCLDDYKLGYQMFGSGRTVPLTTASSSIVNRNNRRTLLIFNSPGSGNATYSMGSPVVVGVGINVTANDRPVILTLKDHGELVTKEWFGIHDTTNIDVTIIEAELSDDSPDYRSRN